MVDYIREFFKSSIEDGISYIEVRFPFFAKSAISGSSTIKQKHLPLLFSEHQSARMARILSSIVIGW